MLVYTFNHMDRNIMAILLNSITQDLHLSDTQAGAMSGFAFAIFYATLGLPIARISDRRNRVNIMTVAIAVWSAMTAVCGLAQNFTQLLLARMAVGVGEAGCVPPAQSVIADYVPVKRRSFAMAVFSLGAPIGTLLGFALGGAISHFYGWRMALFLVGLPGLILAVLVKLTLREPPRGHADGIHPTSDEPPSIGEVLRYLWQRKSLRHATIGASLITFGGYSSATWLPAFFERSHGLNALQTGLWLAPVMVVGGVGGALLAGSIADKWVAKDVRWYTRVPAFAIVCAVPFSATTMLIPRTVYSFMGFDIPSYAVAMPMMVIPGAAFIAYMGPVHSMLQTMVGVRMRGMTVGIFLLITNLIGMGFGPLVIGMVSDFMAELHGAESLRHTMLAFLFIYVWAALHFYRSSRTIPEDLAAVVN